MASPKPLRVLYALHPNFDTLDFTGPLEILSHATHKHTADSSTSESRVFQPTITAVSELTTSAQKAIFKRHIPLTEAHSTLADYDILIIPGGGSQPVLDGQTEPIQLIKAWAALPKKVDGSTRYLLSVCTGCLFLAEAGVLDGLTATTHADYYGQLEKICETKGKTRVLKERFVVNKTDEEKGLRTITSGGDAVQKTSPSYSK
ncbi:Isonitrile Hydratase xanA [Hyphodiscus hymeniophilus]|uniref:Isonitrile Hydratase xanA n=1 Tax=Hyphodiscus hymeniophilus TaxID=353542 RepID=A0A9P6VMJ5_9HELO|nr:Isonitrile Hydratase xanA [Hyphodiscus hymeniophilus]